MKPFERVLYFFILPIIAVMIYPPKLVAGGVGVLLVAVIFFVLLGYMLWRGRSLALTFSIFVQGINVIVRLMIFWNNSFDKQGVPDFAFMITCLLGLALSFWLTGRLDRQDVRAIMVH